MSLVSPSRDRQQNWALVSLWAAAALSIPYFTFQFIRNRLQQSKRDKSASIPSLPLLLAAKNHALKDNSKIAIIDKAKGQSFTYAQLLADVSTLKKQILRTLKLVLTGDLDERRVAFLTPAGYDYVVCQWAVWAAGGVCVPLCRRFSISSNLYRLLLLESNLTHKIYRHNPPYKGTHIHHYGFGSIVDYPSSIV